MSATTPPTATQPGAPPSVVTNPCGATPEKSPVTWAWEIYVKTGERCQRLVASGRCERRCDAAMAIQERLPGVLPLDAYAYAYLYLPDRRRVRAHRVDRVMFWTLR